MTKLKSFSTRRRARVAAVLSLLPLSACGNFAGQNAKTLVDDTSQSIGCSSFESDFYDSLYKITDNGNLPTETQVKAAFAGKNLNPQLTEELTNLYRLIALDGLRQLGQENSEPSEQVATLSSMEIGDQTSPEKEELQTRIRAQLARVKELSAQTSCAKAPAATPEVSAPKAGTLFAEWKTARPGVVYGALKTLNTAYQSCDASQVPALDRNTRDVAGISVVGKHSDGVGNKRVISNVNDLLKTHPYLKNYRKPASNCYDISKNMPIYDYGGRPSTSTGTLNLWKDSGTGTAALGTDCSGYVGMSIATSGLRIKKGLEMKAAHATGVSSSMFTDPQKNGLTCFDVIKLTQASGLKPGDLIAKRGHIVIVESVGQDPFGIAGISSASECKLSNMSVSRFDFTVLQDSPEKGGVGIQRSKAADYFPNEAVMPDGLLEAAVTACKAKFGVSGTAKNSKITVVRHSGSSDCMNKAEIKMDNESCVASCPSL